ncbi:MAG: methyltransferase domain-containing protein [Chloroflexi bacterium]|nr:MAG: methyltransferase domain-containing protein [Chloroflexota bacterium]
MPSSPSDDSRRVFAGIGATYERAGALLSFGQDARWRDRLVAELRAGANDVVLDVATGTGLVARAIRERYVCRVVGLDRSADMLGAASARDGHIPFVRGRAESLPFRDESFDHLTFTYLLRYVDDPAATMSELARVVRPGGRIVGLDFGVPPSPVLRPLWRAYTSIGLPLIGRAISEQWASVGAFLRGSIERFNAAHEQHAVERYWRDAGLTDASWLPARSEPAPPKPSIRDGVPPAPWAGTPSVATRPGAPPPGGPRWRRFRKAPRSTPCVRAVSAITGRCCTRRTPCGTSPTCCSAPRWRRCRIRKSSRVRSLRSFLPLASHRTRSMSFRVVRSAHGFRRACSSHWDRSR